MATSTLASLRTGSATSGVATANATSGAESPVTQSIDSDGQSVESAAQPERVRVAPIPSDEIKQVATRLHTMLDNARKIGTLQGMNGNVFAEIKQNVPRPALFHDGHCLYGDVLSAAKACDKASHMLSAIPMESFTANPVDKRAQAVLEKFVHAQNALYGAIKSFQKKTGVKDLVLESFTMASQFRASEALNFAATMQMMGMEEARQAVFATSTTVDGAMQEASHHMHGTQSAVYELAYTAKELFAQIDRLDSTKAAMPPQEFTTKIARLQDEIGKVQRDLHSLLQKGGFTVPLRDAQGRVEIPVGQAGPDGLMPTAAEPNAVVLKVEHQTFAPLQEMLTLSQNRLTALATANPLDGVKTAIAAITPQLSPKLRTSLSQIGMGSWDFIIEKYNQFAQQLNDDVAQGSVSSDTVKERLEELARLLNSSFMGRASFLDRLYYTISSSNANRFKEGSKEYGCVETILAHVGTTLGACTGSRLRGIAADISAMMSRTTLNPQARDVYIKAAFEHGLDMNFVLEASLRELPLEHVDLRASESQLIGSKVLGQGAVNTVRLCKYAEANGTTRDLVFKPEYAGRNGLEYLCASRLGYKARTQLLQLNLASSHVADAIGCADVIATSSIGFYKNTLGLFMEHAKGVSANGLKCGQACGRDRNGKEYTFKQLMSLARKKGQVATLQGNVARELCKLEWADALSGQVDRHSENYLVDIDPETFAVKVTGIDNDASFGEARLGMQAYVESVPGLPSDKKNGLKQIIPHYIDGPLDLQNIAMTEDNAGLLRESFGLNQFAKPMHIDQETYAKLRAINVGAYKARLAQFLPWDAVEAAGARLEDAKDYAEILHDAGRVVGDWTRADILAETRNVPADLPSLFKNFFARDFGVFYPDQS